MFQNLIWKMSHISHQFLLPLPRPGFHLLLPLLHVVYPVIHKHLSFLCRVSATHRLLPDSALLPASLSSDEGVVQLPSCVQLFATPWTAACQASLCLTISWSLHKVMVFALVMMSSHLILWYPHLLLPSIFPIISDFSNESSVCIRWPKYWSFSISIGPSSDYSGLISLKIDWFDLLAVQGTFRNLLQHHSSKTSILLCSAFFTVQVSQVYMTIGKDYSLDYVDLC